MNITSLFRKSTKVNKSTSERIVHAIVFVIFSFVAFSYLYLIFWCAHSGMRTNSANAKNSFGFGEYSITNYIEVFTSFKVSKTSFWEMIINSMYFSFLGPFLTIFVTAQLAYVTSKYKFLDVVDVLEWLLDLLYVFLRVFQEYVLDVWRSGAVGRRKPLANLLQNHVATDDPDVRCIVHDAVDYGLEFVCDGACIFGRYAYVGGGDL